MSIAGKVCEEFRDFRFRHLVRMTFVVKQDETSNPFRVTLFVADTEMFSTNSIPDLVEQFPLVRLRSRR
jgi:hypothetical protein